MKLKQLEANLSQLVQFQNPKIELEQYSTSAHIASRMLYLANDSYDDIRGKVVVDMGCGCGILGIAASSLSASHVVGIDIDADALDVARVNAEECEEPIDFIHSNVANCSLKGWNVDTVVMNPPFGTRKKGADIMFLFSAFQMVDGAVYSLHKTSTRNYIRKYALQTYGAKTAEVLCELRYDLPALYKFHKKQEVDIMVDLWRFTVRKSIVSDHEKEKQFHETDLT